MITFFIGLLIGVGLGIVIESTGDDDGYSRGNRN